MSGFAYGSTTPTSTLTGLDDPDALAFNSSGDLYVANDTALGTVSVFTLVGTTPIATFTGLTDPDALAFDSTGDLFVANEGAGTVSEFTPGSTAPTGTLTIGLGTRPDALAFDAGDDLFVANYVAGTVSVFTLVGSTTPAVTLTGLTGPDALAFDSNGNLYVANYGSGTVSEFAPGSTTPTATLTGLNFPDALAFDSSGDLFVANEGRGSGTTVSEFTPVSVGPPTAGGVVIRSSLSTRPMNLGGAAGAVAGINLTDAELAQIQTTVPGTLTVGDTTQSGNITFTTATPATTPGASTRVVQDFAGAGQIILDDGDGAATALNGNGGPIALNAGTGGIVAASANNTAAEIATTGATVTLDTTGPIGTSSNRIQFTDDPNTAQQNVIVGWPSPSVFLDGLGSLTLGSIYE